MIRKVSVVISFPFGAAFTEGISKSIYTRFLAFIKDLSCLCVNTKCIECDVCSNCKYYKITGNNFSKYPAVFIRFDLFEKKIYAKNELKSFDFYLIGNNSKFQDYISLFFENLHQNLSGSFFYLKEVKVTDLEESFASTAKVKLLTPIEKSSFIDSYNEMIQYYNDNYSTSFLLISAEEQITEEREVTLPIFSVSTRKITGKGKIQNIFFSNEIVLDERLLLLGIGKFNFMGGGQVEIEN